MNSTNVAAAFNNGLPTVCSRLSDDETRALHEQQPLVVSEAGGDAAPVIEDGLQFSAALTEELDPHIIGYRARAHTPLLDLSQVGGHDVDPFWQPIRPRDRGVLVLEPDAFYVLASHERVAVPATVCAEMVPFDAKSGELRTHYAGFFDSGFGRGGGARVVLEIRNRDTPFLLRHRQRIFRFQLYRNLAVPAALYIAVAQVLTYVYQLKAAVDRGMPPPPPPVVDVPEPDPQPSN